MARYIVEGPDGKRYIVEGPDGAAAPTQGGSPTQAQQTQPEAAQPFQRAGAGAGYGRGNTTAASAGVNDAVIKTFLGLKSLVTDLSEDDKYALRGMRQEKEEDPEGFKRGAGEFGGNVLIGAIPGSKIAGMASKAVNVGSKLAPYFGTAMGAAGTEFLQHPSEEEGLGGRMLDKAASAGKAAITAPLVQLGLRGMGKAITQPFKPTPEAARLMEQGMQPTLQQGSAGPAGRVLGGMTAGIVDVKKRLRDEAGDIMLKRATNGARELPEGTGGSIAGLADDALQQEYNAFWKGHTVNLSPTAAKALALKAGHVLSNNRQADDAMKARAIVADLVGDGNTNLRMGYDKFAREVRNPLSTKMREAPSEGVRARLSESRELADQMITRQGRSVGDIAKLEDMNRRMFDVKRMQEAIPPGQGAAEGLDITALARAFEKNLPQAAKAGNTTYQEFVEPARRLIANTPTQHSARALMGAAGKTGVVGALGAGGLGLGTGGLGLGALVALSALSQTGKGAKALMGGTETQKKIAKILQELGPAAQALYTGTATTKADGEE